MALSSFDEKPWFFANERGSTQNLQILLSLLTCTCNVLITIEAKEKESKSIRQLFDRWHDAVIFITERIWINSSNSFAFLVSWYFTDFFGEVHEQRQNKK
jgi:hypothetical protein